jgi:PilZ domain
MSSPPVQVERRVGQRFPYALAVSLLDPSSSERGVGFTQDLSSRGAFFFTEIPLTEGSQVELTLQMPSEITLGESMPVKCRGRVLRVLKPSAPGGLGADGKKIGVAVRLESYEYLTIQPDFQVAHTRISPSHPNHEHKTATTPLQS